MVDPMKENEEEKTNLSLLLIKTMFERDIQSLLQQELTIVDKCPDHFAEEYHGQIAEKFRMMIVFARLIRRLGVRRLLTSLLLIGAVYCVFNVMRNGTGLTAIKRPISVDATKLAYFPPAQRSDLTFDNKPTLEMTGRERAGYLRTACLRLKAMPQSGHGGYSKYAARRIRVSYDHQHDAMFCPMCKVASTFWTRVFKMVERNKEHHRTVAETPFSIQIADAPASNQHFDMDMQAVTPEIHDVTSAFKFLFVRSPHSHLFSAFVDKIVGPNPIMWRHFGEKGIALVRETNSTACGNDVTFREFVEFVLHEYFSRHAHDCHVAKVTACSPCSANYTFVGLMETFKDDTFKILAQLKQNHTLEVFKTQFTDLHAIDAIDDSISGPFSWKKSITDCMPWPEGLRRIWRKLQIRGILGAAKFPLTDKEAETVSREDFIKLANQAREVTSSEEKKRVKKEAFTEAFSTLSDDLLGKVYTMYSEEMLLFGYKPLEIGLLQKQAAEHIYIGYMNYSKEIE